MSAGGREEGRAASRKAGPTKERGESVGDLPSARTSRRHVEKGSSASWAPPTAGTKWPASEMGGSWVATGWSET